MEAKRYVLAESRRIVRQKKSGELIQITGWVRESDDGDDNRMEEDTYVGPVNERFFYPVTHFDVWVVQPA